MFRSQLVLVCLLHLIVSDEAARILAVFPTPSISHQVVFRPLTQELAKRGHEVVILTPDPAFPKGQTPENLTEIDLHDVSYKIWRELFLTAPMGSKEDLIAQMTIGFRLIADLFEKQLQTKAVQELIINKQQHFDLVLVEACAQQALIFSHVFKAPAILISSFGPIPGNFETIGAPVHPLLYPTPLRQRIFNLSVWEKLSELRTNYLIDDKMRSNFVYIDEILQRNFGPGTPKLSELEDYIQMLFLNVHPIWDGNRPVPPSVVYMGGLHVKPEKQLPNDLKSYLDSSKHGVIYMSFGTNVGVVHFTEDKIKMFIKAFSQLPYDILWKWDKDELPGRLDNIKISKWLPQSDLLKHPKIKLFITQGGLQSTDEALTAGVPLIGIPMLGDQWFNVEKYVQLKLGLRLDMDSLTSDILKDAINIVIGDKTYRSNVVHLNSILRDQPMSPLERAVWWTEHVIRHKGAPHLRAPAAQMTWREYLELDLIFTVLSCLLITLALISYILYKLLIKGNIFTSIKMKKH